MNLFKVMPSRRAPAEGYIDNKVVDLRLAESIARHTFKLQLNKQMLFPKTVEHQHSLFLTPIQ